MTEDRKKTTVRANTRSTLRFSRIDSAAGFVIFVPFSAVFWLFSDEFSSVAYFIAAYLVFVIMMFLSFWEILFKKAWIEDDVLKIRMYSPRIHLVRYGDISTIELKLGPGRFRHSFDIGTCGGKSYSFPVSMKNTKEFSVLLAEKVKEYKEIRQIGTYTWLA